MANSSGGGPRRTSRRETFCSACSPGARGRQYRVRSDVRARLLGELGASVDQRPPTRRPPPVSWTTRTRPHFHHTGCHWGGIKDCWRIRPRGLTLLHDSYPVVYLMGATQPSLGLEDRTDGFAPWMTSLASAA